MSEQIEEPSYNQNEVETLLLKVLELGMSIKENQMNGLETKNHLEIFNELWNNNILNKSLKQK